MSNSPHHWLGLEGQVCVVTGAASGIGAAIAQGIAPRVPAKLDVGQISDIIKVDSPDTLRPKERKFS